MKTILVIITLTFFTQFDAQCQALPSEKDKYEFLSWYINTYQPKQLSYNLQRVTNFGFDPAEIDGLSEKRSSLTKADKQFLKRQIAADPASQILDSTRIIYSHWKKKGDPAVPVTTLSMPIFSKNKKMAFINISYVCGGECGEGGMQFFVKIKGKWQSFPLDGLSHWIS